MEEQQSFALEDKVYFRSDQYSKEDLQLQIAQMQRQLLGLQHKNQQLQRLLEKALSVDADDKNGADMATGADFAPSLIQPEADSMAVLWGPRYRSKNPELGDIVIPAARQPDHCFTKDDLQYFVETKCSHSQPQKPPSGSTEEKGQSVLRKLILSRERRLHNPCESCGEPVVYRLLEKHLEVDFFVEPEAASTIKTDL